MIIYKCNEIRAGRDLGGLVSYIGRPIIIALRYEFNGLGVLKEEVVDAPGPLLFLSVSKDLASDLQASGFFLDDEGVNTN